MARALIPLFGLLVGCLVSTPVGATASERGPTLVFDTGGRAELFDLPFPNDARRLPNGAPDLCALRNPRAIGFIDATRRLAHHDARGFAPVGVIGFRFDAALPPLLDDPLRSRGADASIMLVDVDPDSPQRLQRRAFHLAVTARADSVRPAHLLQLLPVPGLGLRPNTTYAVVVLRDLVPGAPRLGLSEPLLRLLDGRPPCCGDKALGHRLVEAYAPLVRALPDLGLAPEEIAAATVFTTGDPTAALTRLVGHLREGPPPRLVSLAAVEERPGYSVLEGEVEIPLYQAGRAPYILGGGALVLDQRGLPIAQRHIRAPFTLTLPHRPVPQGGFPLYLYLHGTGGRARQVVDRGYQATVDAAPAADSGIAALGAAAGWATACMAGAFSPDRIGARAIDGYAAYNVFNPVAHRDNYAQMVLEQVLFLSLLRALRVDPVLAPALDTPASADGKISFNAERLVVGGQSLGSHLATILAATHGGFSGVVLSGAGGSFIDFALGPKDPIDVQATFELLTLPHGERLDRFHPYLSLLELAAAPADSTLYAAQLLRRPRADSSPPHVLVIEGHLDRQVAINSQRALVLALGVDLLGNDVGERSEDRIETVLPWGGQAKLWGQAQGNLRLASGAQRTAVVVRYPEDGVLEGHYVAFQRPEPRAQIKEFLEAIAVGEQPRILDRSVVLQPASAAPQPVP